MKVVICSECAKQFEIWLLHQAKHDSSPSKMRQTKAYLLWQRFVIEQDFEVK